jgi:hypothetical protein
MSTVLVQSRDLYGRLKREIAESILSQALMLLGHSSENNYRRLSGAFSRIAKTEHQRRISVLSSTTPR